MKARVVNSDNLVREVRFNKNVTIKPNKISVSPGNRDKKDYSAITLLFLMNELGYVDVTNIRDSFGEVKKYVNKYEEK